MSFHLMSTREVCAELRISPSTLYSWRTAGVGPPAKKVGKHLRFPREGFERWLAELSDGPSQRARIRHLKAVD